MAQHPQLALPNDLNKDIWSYYKLLWTNPIVFGDHLAVILQVPLFDKLLVINLYTPYNLPILYPTFQKHFWYSLVGEYLSPLSDSDYATFPSEQDMITSILKRSHICWFDMALYPTEKVSCYLSSLFVNDVEWVRMNCNCEGNLQTN